jgi:hypothetical protein
MTWAALLPAFASVVVLGWLALLVVVVARLLYSIARAMRGRR